MRYTVVLLQEADGRYSVTIPALPGIATFGDDIPDAIANTIDAATLHIEGYAPDSVPDELPGTVVVSLELPSPTMVESAA